MTRRGQTRLPGFEETLRLDHGGELRIGKRKTARPIATKRTMHLTMRASIARGPWSLLQKKNARFISEEIQKQSKRFRVRVFRFANVGNHIHLLIQARDREGFQSFVRALPGRIAQFVTGAKKGIALKARFWDLPVHSRIVDWGKALDSVKKYIQQNIDEAAGRIPNKPRPKKKAPRSSSTATRETMHSKQTRPKPAGQQ